MVPILHLELEAGDTLVQNLSSLPEQGSLLGVRGKCENFSFKLFLSGKGNI